MHRGLYALVEKFLDSFGDWLRLMKYGHQTKKSYLYYTNKYNLFQNKYQPKELESPEVNQFLFIRLQEKRRNIFSRQDPKCLSFSAP